MRKAAGDLEFEEAARLRDEIRRLEANELSVANDPLARATGGKAVAPKGRGKGRSRAGKPGTRQMKAKTSPSKMGF